MSDLHGQIMNLPAHPSPNLDDAELMAYKEGHRDARHAAAELALSAPQVKPLPPATVPDNMQDWKGMDGAIAYHLIDRHADNWNDIGKMMGEWLDANQGSAKPLTGEDVYMAGYGHQGGIWSANEHQDVWNAWADRLNARDEP